MKKPMDRGAPLDAKRFNRWLAEFAGYRNPVTQMLIELWLDQFAPIDKELAARILDAVLFISTQAIHTGLRELVGALEGWSKTKKNRRGRWFFVPFSGSVGESGDSMLYTLRMATSMTKKRYNEFFIHRSELTAKNPGPEDTVVLVDDFSGSGDQACKDAWPLFEELLTGGPKIVLMMVAATDRALARITDETDMSPVCTVRLTKKDDLFQPECIHFTEGEKNTILNYCKTANPERPKGWQECGLLLVLAHKTPNNSIPILHSTNDQWRGLFPRH
ncbi:MAG: phosphoribosyltransferase-like protein [Candidatus Sulfotelmatobacter sp.]